jgi:excisionase family DNA binding protein
MATSAEEREKLLRVQDVAAELDQSLSAVYRKIAAGELPAVRLGHGERAPIRVPERAFRAWLYGSGEAA